MSRNRESEKAGSATCDDTALRGSFITRLQHILGHWPSADRLARATGVSPSAFRKWLRGEAEPSRERLVALAQAAGVSVGWLAAGEGAAPKLRAPDSQPAGTTDEGSLGSDYVLLPRRAVAAAAGPETPDVASRAAEFMALRHDWIRSALGIEPDRLLLETAAGESMLPGIQDGDLLLIDATETRFRSFGVYVFEIAGERLVKRVQPKLDGSVTLISDNPAYEAEYVQAAQAASINVIGRVVWTCGPTRGSR